MRNDDPSLEEMKDRLDGLDRKVSLMPTLSGYYDLDYVATTKPGSHNSFDQHHVSLHLTKEYKDFRLFSEIEFEHGTRIEAEDGAIKEARGEVKLEQAGASISSRICSPCVAG